MSRSETSGLTPTAAALLIGAPVLMVVARLLLVPFADGEAWNEVLTQAAVHQSRSDAGWVMGMAASGLLGAGAIYLAGLLRAAGRTKAAAFAVVTTALGWAGAAGMSAAGLLFSYQGKAPDRAVQIQLMKDVNAGHSAFIFLMCVVAAVGYVVLAVGLSRSKVVGKGVGVLVGLGGAGTLLTTAGSERPLLLLSTLLLLAGQLLVVRAAGFESGIPSEPVAAWQPVTG